MKVKIKLSDNNKKIFKSFKNVEFVTYTWHHFLTKPNKLIIIALYTYSSKLNWIRIRSISKGWRSNRCDKFGLVQFDFMEDFCDATVNALIFPLSSLTNGPTHCEISQNLQGGQWNTTSWSTLVSLELIT